MVIKARQIPQPAPEKLLRLDLGCGRTVKDGFLGVDIIGREGIFPWDLRVTPWPWADGSVAEVHCSHFLEHLTGAERIPFFNELWRVMAPDAKGIVIVPHWKSSRAYGDPSHQWPPVSEMFWCYLSRDWREQNAPHIGFDCNFNTVGIYVVAPAWQNRSNETQQFALTHYTEVALDMVVTLTRLA